ncbi:hypothetical protein pb186bvf_003713 [Paramecium bursaria]
MRAFTKVSYFNRTKTPEVRKSNTKIPQLKSGMDQLDKYYKKQLAKGFRNLIINMIQGFESDVQKIKKSNAFHKQRMIQKVFQSWKEQSQKPQPYQHLKPASPPKMMNITISEFKGQLSAKSTSRSISKRQPTSPLKAIKKELDIKFFTPNRTTSKKVTRTTSRLRTQNFEIGQEESPVVSNLLGKYYKKKVFKVLLNFLLFQRHQKFKAQHFRNFYISRLSFNILKNHRKARQIKIGGIQNNQQEFVRGKEKDLLRINLSSWYFKTQKKINSRKAIQILMNSLQKTYLIRTFFTIKEFADRKWKNLLESKLSVQQVSQLFKTSESKKLTLIPVNQSKKSTKK